MPINLSKGQKVDLTKGNPGLTKIMVGLGWDVNKGDYYKTERFMVTSYIFYVSVSSNISVQIKVYPE